MTTDIEWVRNPDGSKGETWNPVTGCTKVSPGCDHCYAERITNRFGGPGAFDKVILHPERLEQPLHWRKPRMVFTCSMADLFHDDVPDEFIARVFQTMWQADRHTFQVLTKRHARIGAWMRRVARCEHGWVTHNGENPSAYGGTGIIVGDPWPLANVWLGVSVENQQWADIRIPRLLETPAAVRFLSCEPLLGPIDLHPFLRLRYGSKSETYPPVDWVIVGGESGPDARPMHPDWARSIRDQCVSAGVPYFLKQRGAWTWDGPLESFTHLLHANGSLVERESATWTVPLNPQSTHTPYREEDLVDRGHAGWVRVRNVGKHAAGRELDGRTWDELPTLGTLEVAR